MDPSPIAQPGTSGRRTVALLLGIVAAVVAVGVATSRAVPFRRIVAFDTIEVRDGAVVGVSRLPRDALQQRAYHFRATLEDDRLLRVVRLNRAGWPDVEPGAWFELDPLRTGPVALRQVFEGDVLVRTEHLDVADNVVHQIRFERDGDVLRLVHLDARSVPEPLRGVKVEEQELDPQGRPKTIRYLDRPGTPTAASDGSFGEARAYDAQGRLVAVAPLGPDGRPGPARVWSYGEEHPHRPVQISGGLARGCAERRFRYDRVGNLVERSCFDAAGAPAPFAGLPCTSVARSVSIARRRSTCLGPSGPTATQDGWTTLERRTDPHGYMLSLRLLGPEGELVDGSDGVAVTEWTHSEAGVWITRGPHTSAAGEVVPDGRGVWSERRELDERGRVLEHVYLDRDGRPTTGP